MDKETLTISAVSALVAALLSALLTAWLGTKTHISQRWWEAKAEAYSSVMSQLARLSGSLRDLLEELSDDDVDAAEINAHFARWEAAAHEIEQVARQRAFKISPEACSLLHRASQAIQRPPGHSIDQRQLTAWLTSVAVEVESTIDSFCTEARRDLGVLPRSERLRFFRANRSRSSR